MNNFQQTANIIDKNKTKFGEAEVSFKLHFFPVNI